MKKILIAIVLLLATLIYFYFDNKDVVIAVEAQVKSINDPSGKLKELLQEGESVKGRLHIPYMLWKSHLSGQKKQMNKYVLPGGEASFLFNLGKMGIVSNEESKTIIEILNDSGEKKEDYFLIRFINGAVGGVDSEKVTFTLQLHDPDGNALSSESLPSSFDLQAWSGGKDLSLRVQLRASKDEPARRGGPQQFMIQSEVSEVSVLRK